MNKYIFCLVLFFFRYGFLSAQDMVHTTDGRTINVKVVEVGLDNIIYTKDGSVERKMPKAEIKKIVYSNGIEEIFMKERTTTVPEKKAEVQTAVAPTINKPNQYGVKKGYIGIAFGIARPTGDLGDSRASNPKSNYALAGGFGELEGGYYLLPYFAIAAKFGYSGFTVNDVGLKRNLNNSLGLTSADASDDAGFSSSLNADPSSISYSLIGFKGCLPLNKLSLELGLWLGSASTEIGASSYSASFYDDSFNLYDYSLSAKKYQSASLARGLDFQIKYDVLSRLTIGLGLGIYSTGTNFENVEITQNLSINDIVIETNKEQIPDSRINGRWGTFNIGLNLFYTFRKKQ